MSLTTPDWTEPGIFEIGNGIHRVPLPLPQDVLRAVNVYVIESDVGLILIDSGWALPESEAALSESLSTIGYALSDIDKFLITHIHRDHYSQALTLRAEYGADVYLGIGERESLINLQGRGPQDALVTEISALLQSGADELVATLRQQRSLADNDSASWTEPTFWVESGDEIYIAGRSLEAIETPGHTRGHMVFRDAARNLLFAGDHVLPSITPSIGFEPVRAPLPLKSYLDSLTLLLTLDDCLLLPAHGAPGGSVHARVKQLLDHHSARLNEMEAAIGSSSRTAYEVAQIIKWTRRDRDFDELDPFNRMLAVLETDSHLKLLAADRRLLNTPSHGVDHFAGRQSSELVPNLAVGIVTPQER